MSAGTRAAFPVPTGSLYRALAVGPGFRAAGMRSLLAGVGLCRRP
ncbi:hypothetical protein [Streptomyces sp. NL15-2K]|nr:MULTISPECIES: hypothetical protein [Actinomycetes]WKX13712.1 hypothetical protein Q4V64_41770 [Kutzneria buriramensis]GCB44880.1 hypothetical protein SNL152K_2170 [Streptomyces sp. NL15-2K]